MLPIGAHDFTDPDQTVQCLFFSVGPEKGFKLQKLSDYVRHNELIVISRCDLLERKGTSPGRLGGAFKCGVIVEVLRSIFLLNNNVL